MSCKLKFCGLRREEDIEYANETSPDYIGFVFAKSKRQISNDTAKILKKRLKYGIISVGVFVDSPLEEIVEYNDAADVFQLHGNENAQYISKLRTLLPHKEIWKAVRVRNADDIANAMALDADKFVFDAFSPSAYGGTGLTLDFDLITSTRQLIDRPFFIAGGINADNIAETEARLEPFGIDLSSGIETDGYKDLQKMKAITSILKRR